MQGDEIHHATAKIRFCDRFRQEIVRSCFRTASNLAVVPQGRNEHDQRSVIVFNLTTQFIRVWSNEFSVKQHKMSLVLLQLIEAVRTVVNGSEVPASFRDRVAKQCRVRVGASSGENSDCGRHVCPTF